MTYIEIRARQVAIAKWLDKVAEKIWEEILYGRAENAMPEGMKNIFRKDHMEHAEVFKIEWEGK